MSVPAGVEVWRGIPDAREIDDVGRLKLGFFVATAAEGLVGVAAAMGLDGAFRERATATLLVEDQHIRLLRHGRGRTHLHMLAGVIELGDHDARVLQVLADTATGDVVALFETHVSHVTARDTRPFAWSPRTRRATAMLRISLPEVEVFPTMASSPWHEHGSLRDADRVGLTCSARGAIGVADCDVFGRVRPEVLIRRAADGLSAPHASSTGEDLRQTPGEAADAIVECRYAFSGWPRVGDRFEIRSGLTKVGDETPFWTHWMIDPRSGDPWARADMAVAGMTLDSPRTISLSAEQRKSKM